MNAFVDAANRSTMVKVPKLTVKRGRSQKFKAFQLHEVRVRLSFEVINVHSKGAS